ncbi:S-adenosyl-L-methionine-dependent methyltransferase [Dactylonectria estremocensis]|uniref:S-adenosyl-L-methionine-dependent methyltransferase n=1 Tax=Dactylonectria estremocensis TaxID=1079267 RepID=A0A9P9F1D8_9HYPO|nr:S-adenosyl-L-methionine-dependent methyltransferase [Dactylonectria estremocensis]
MAIHDSDLELVPDNQENASSTQTLSSSILDYRRENGRTYHRYKDGKYNLPNDAQEAERLDLQHHLFLLTFDDTLGLAPPNKAGSQVKRVLDLGTGTGIWAMDFGDEHPEAHVVGVDLSPIQPSFVPPNVEFFVDDIDEEWNHSKPFDYIHSRMMTSSIANWRVYLQKIYDNLAPGGYAELQEADLFLSSDDDTLTADHALVRCLQLMHEASVQFGRAFQEIQPLKAMMEEIGFVDVARARRKWPTNTWPQDKRHKELGAWSRMNLDGGLEAFTMAPLTRAHGWSREQVVLFLVDVRRDLNDRGIHAYWPVYSIYGKKPE